MLYIRGAAKAKAGLAGTALRRNTREFGGWHRGACCFPGAVQYADRDVPSSEHPAWIVSPPLWSARIPSPAIKVLKYTATGCLTTEERHSRRDCSHNVGAAPPAPRVCKTPFPQMTSGIRFLALQHPSVHGSTGGGLSLGDFPSALVPLLGHGPSSLGCPPGPVAMHSTAGLSVGLVGQSLIAPFQKHGAGRRHTATRSDRPGKIVFRRGKDRVGQLPRWAGRHSVSQGRSFPVSGNVGIPDTARHASR